MDQDAWDFVKEQLLPDLPFEPAGWSVKSVYDEPDVLEVSFRRELTPEETALIRQAQGWRF
jgi:hypothetical protein